MEVLLVPETSPPQVFKKHTLGGWATHSSTPDPLPVGAKRKKAH